jgi:hypothetical protein
MLSDSNDVSHKRVIALGAFVVFIILAFFSAYGHNTDPQVLYILGSLIGGESALSVIEKFKNQQQ